MIINISLTLYFKKLFFISIKNAGMVELVDTSDLGPGGLGLVGSSPTARRLNFKKILTNKFNYDQSIKQLF